MASWDDEDFEPAAVVPHVALNSNKWEGEDEEDEVKDNWEDEDEDKEKDKDIVDDVKIKPKKKSLAEKIAEKESKKREEMEKRLREQQESELTEEEKIRMEKESDLNIALETTFGLSNNNTVTTGFDGLALPQTKDEFQEFNEILSKKLLTLSKNTEYINFVESLLRNLCATMSSLDVKKVKNTIDNLYLEKQKIEKGEKTKKNKGKGKAKLKLDDGNPLSAYVNEYDDYDTFM